MNRHKRRFYKKIALKLFLWMFIYPTVVYVSGRMIGEHLEHNRLMARLEKNEKYKACAEKAGL